MSGLDKGVFLSDKGGRRSGSDRRQFSYSDHIPERRDDDDRRNGIDRRSGVGDKYGTERRAVFG